MVTCFRCGERGHYASECDATSEEVQQYHASQSQATKHDSGEQFLHSGVLQDDPDSNITTSWIFNQIHVVHDQTHIETRHGGRLGKPVLYVELVKALYGTIRAALIFWRKFTKQITEWGFTVNPYDWCVANKWFAEVN